VSQSSAPVSLLGTPVSTDQLREFIAGINTVINPKILNDCTPFSDAGADSLDLFNLVLAIEDRYHVTIPDDQLGEINTLEKLARYLNERLP
jgi:acyl carrier protein